jgi:hypothetical protein
MSSVKALSLCRLPLKLFAAIHVLTASFAFGQYGASPSQTGMFFDDLRMRQINERTATQASTRDGDVAYDYDSGVYRDSNDAPMGQRSADFEAARQISRPAVRSGSGAFAARSVGDFTNYAGQYTSPTGFFAPTYTSDPFLNGRRNIKIGPANVGFGLFQGFEYNDNITRSDINPVSDFISTTLLSIDANYQITQNNRLSISTAVGFDRYWENPELAPYGSDGLVLNVLPGSTIAFDVKAGPVFFTIYNRFSVRPAARNDFALAQNQFFGMFQNDSGMAANWRINSDWTLALNYMHSNSRALATPVDDGSGGTQDQTFDDFNRVTDSLQGSLTYSPNGTWVAGLEGGTMAVDYKTGFNPDGVLNNFGAFVVLPIGKTTSIRAAAGTQIFEFDRVTPANRSTVPAGIGSTPPSLLSVTSGDNSDLNDFYYSFTLNNQLNSRVSQALSVGREAALNINSNYILADFANYGLSFIAWKGSRINLSGYIENATASGGAFAQDIFQYGFDIHVAHRLTSNLQLGVGYHYGYSDPSLGAGANRFAPGSPGSGQVVFDNGHFVQQAFNVDLTYVLNARANLNLGYRYYTTDVSGGAGSFDQNRIVLGFNYNF